MTHTESGAAAEEAPVVSSRSRLIFLFVSGRMSLSRVSYIILDQIAKASINVSTTQDQGSSVNNLG